MESKHKSDYGKFVLTAGKFYGDAEMNKGGWKGATLWLRGLSFQYKRYIKQFWSSTNSKQWWFLYEWSSGWATHSCFPKLNPFGNLGKNRKLFSYSTFKQKKKRNVQAYIAYFIWTKEMLLRKVNILIHTGLLLLRHFFMLWKFFSNGKFKQNSKFLSIFYCSRYLSFIQLTWQCAAKPLNY